VKDGTRIEVTAERDDVVTRLPIPWIGQLPQG
jgi:hypothetical protein